MLTSENKSYSPEMGGSRRGQDKTQQAKREQVLVRKSLQESAPHAIVFTVEPAFDCGRNGAGGAARTVSEHWQGLNKNGIQTTLITPKPAGLTEDQAQTKGTHLYDLGEMVSAAGETGNPNHVSSDKLVDIYGHPWVKGRLKESLPNGHGGVTLAHFYTSHPLVSDESNIAYFHHSPFTPVREQYDPRMIGAKRDSSKSSIVRTRIENWMLSNAAAVGVFTNAEAQLTQDVYPGHALSDKMQAIPLGIDMNRFNPKVKEKLRPELRNRFGIPSDAKVLYMQARVGASMGQLPLAEMFSREMMDNPQLYLAIVGDAARGEEGYYEQIKELQKSSNGKLVLTGSLKDQEGHSLGDINVGFKLETFGYSNLEGMAMGNPLITQDNPIHREVYGDDPGVLYVQLPALVREMHSSTVGKQTGDILEFVNNPKYSKEAKKWNTLIAQKYPWEKSIEKLERVMHEIKTNK